MGARDFREIADNLATAQAISRRTLVSANDFPFLAPFPATRRGRFYPTFVDYPPKRGRLGRRWIVRDFREIVDNLTMSLAMPY